MNIPLDSIMIIIQFLPYSTQVQVCPELKKTIESIQAKIITRSIKNNRLRIMNLIDREVAPVNVARAAYCLYHEPTSIKFIRLKFPEIQIAQDQPLKKQHRLAIYKLSYSQLVCLGW